MTFSEKAKRRRNRLSEAREASRSILSSSSLKSQCDLDDPVLAKDRAASVSPSVVQQLQEQETLLGAIRTPDRPEG